MSKKQDILTAAKRLFSHHGYSTVTTRLIAHEAGCSELTLFRQFGSKENLLKSILDDFNECSKWNDYMESCMNGTLEEDVTTFCDLYLKFLKENIHIYKIQLKLSDDNEEKFKMTTNIKKMAVKKFQQHFKSRDLQISPDLFVNQMVSSIMGIFTIDVLTFSKFTRRSLKSCVDYLVETQICYIKSMEQRS